MTDGINVDFSPLEKSNDFVGDYTNAFQIGRQLQGQQITSNAFQAYGANPTAPIDPRLYAANPELAVQLQNRQQDQSDRTAKIAAATAVAGNNPAAEALAPTGDVAGTSALVTAQQKAQADAADKVAGTVQGLLGIADPQQRLNTAQHIVQTSPQAAAFLREMGADPANLTVDSVSNGNLAMLLHHVLGYKESQALDKPQVVGKDSKLLFQPGSLGSVGDDATTPGSAPGAAPAASTAPSPVQQIPGATGATINQAGASLNATPAEMNYLHQTARIESSGNQDAQNGSSTGLFQFHPSTFNQALPGGDINSAFDQSKAALNLARQDGPKLQAALGRAPTSGELYLAHQQGSTVASALLTAPPDVNAISVLESAGVSPRIAKLSITGNGGTADTTAGQFADHWRSKFGDAPASGNAAPGSTPALASPASSGAQSLPGGYRMVTPGGGADDATAHGHVSTATELKTAGLAANTQAWTDAKGEVKPLPTGFAKQADANAPILGDATKTGAAYLATIPDQDRSMVQAMIDGRTPFPSAAAMRNPDVIRMMREATQADPTFNAGTAPARASLWKSMTSGPDSIRITAINQALFHATNLADAYDQRNNVNAGVASGPINWIKNAFQDPSTGNDKAVDADATALSTEVAKAFQAGAPHEAEIKHWLGILNQPDAAPPQQRQALQSVTELLHGSLQATQSKFQAGIGKMGSQLQVIHPDAAQAYQRLSTLNTRLGQGGSKAGSPAPAPATSRAAPTGLQHLSQEQLEAMAAGH